MIVKGYIMCNLGIVLLNTKIQKLISTTIINICNTHFKSHRLRYWGDYIWSAKSKSKNVLKLNILKYLNYAYVTASLHQECTKRRSVELVETVFQMNYLHTSRDLTL